MLPQTCPTFQYFSIIDKKKFGTFRTVPKPMPTATTLAAILSTASTDPGQVNWTKIIEETTMANDEAVDYTWSIEATPLRRNDIYIMGCDQRFRGVI